MSGLLEKIIANWLDSCSERSYQIPFCFFLINDGHRLLHSTRHNPLELGKDIVSMDSSGTICAFQLKGNPGQNLSISQWQSISGQIQDLVVGDIAHPSVKKSKKFKPFLVTNGQLEEEVWRAIGDMNRTFQKRYKRTLGVLCRGDLLEMAKRASLAIWPTELEDTFTFLQLFTQNGKDPLTKKKFAKFLESSLDLDKEDEKPNLALAKRKITSAALICSLSLTPFVKEKNYSSIISGWSIYIACLLAYIARWEFPEKIYKSSLDLAKEAILQGIVCLLNEFNHCKHLVEGDFVTDKLFSIDRVRATFLCAYASILGLHQLYNEDPILIDKETLKTIFQKCRSKMIIWGESAISLYLIVFWFWRTIEPTQEPQKFLVNIFKGLCQANSPNSDHPYPPPHYDVDHLIRELLIEAEELKEYRFSGASYTLESLLLLLVKNNWKQTVKNHWPEFTRIIQMSFKPKEPWQFFLWHSKHGTNVHHVPIIPCSWNDLKKRTVKASLRAPKQFEKDPILFLIFLFTYPHRISTDAIIWLDEVLKELI